MGIKSILFSKYFSGDSIVVVPDMQREYCWATTDSLHHDGSLVYGFIVDLLRRDEIKLGLLYDYAGRRDGELVLCDGQQRLTTLFLLTAYVYCHGASVTNKEDKKVLKNILIAKDEPRLKYEIRDTTQFFLRDFIFEYVLSFDSVSNTDISSQEWYVQEYGLDPSAANMVIAWGEIDKAIRDISSSQNLSIDEILGKAEKLIVSGISFLENQLESPEMGERQFVVLNTTGMTLSQTENLKSTLLGGLKGDELSSYADIWEGWEQFFWLRRKVSKSEHKTADAGLRELFRWAYIIENLSKWNESEIGNQDFSLQAHFETGQFSALKIHAEWYEQDKNYKRLMDLLNDYYKTFAKLVENDWFESRYARYRANEAQLCLFNQIQGFELIPVFRYAMKHDDKIGDRDFQRICMFFESKAKSESIRANPARAMIHALRFVENMTDTDIVNSVTTRSFIMNDFDVQMFKYYRDNPDLRLRLEELNWRAERLDVSNGDIQYLYDLLGRDNLLADFDYYETAIVVTKLTVNDPDHFGGDLFRRALLASGDYGIHIGEAPSINASRYQYGDSAATFKNIIHRSEFQTQCEIVLSWLKQIIVVTHDAVKMECAAETELSACRVMKIETFIKNKMEGQISSFVGCDDCSWEIVRRLLIQDKKWFAYMQRKILAEKEDGTCWAFSKQTASAENKQIC